MNEWSSAHSGDSSTQHNALHCQVGLASGHSLGGDWGRRRRPGRPRARWTDQLHSDTGDSCQPFETGCSAGATRRTAGVGYATTTKTTTTATTESIAYLQNVQMSWNDCSGLADASTKVPKNRPHFPFATPQSSSMSVLLHVSRSVFSNPLNLFNDLWLYETACSSAILNYNYDYNRPFCIGLQTMRDH